DLACSQLAAQTLLFLVTPRHPGPHLFPYTTLFRSRGVWGDEQRYRDTYWAQYAEQGYYFAGDGAKYDADGDIWLLGRVDDVMNVDRKSTRLNSSHVKISYAVFCLKKKTDNRKTVPC